MLWTWIIAGALAQDTPRPIGLDDVVAVDTSSVDTYVFTIPTCERIRTTFQDERPADARRSDQVVVTIRNTGPQMCLYKGVALAGFLEGTYASSLRNPNGTGLFVPPGGEVSLRIKPSRPHLPRAAVELQIPPGRQMILLTGLAPASSPEQNAP